MIKKVELDEIRDRLEECLMELGDHYPEGADEMIQNDFHGYSQIR